MLYAVDNDHLDYFEFFPFVRTIAMASHVIQTEKTGDDAANEDDPLIFLDLDGVMNYTAGNTQLILEKECVER